MATNSAGGVEADPSEQLQQTLKAVTGALEAATERVQAGSQAVGLRAIKQAEDNTALLFSTLRELATTKEPSAFASLYSQFLNRSAQQHAQQLQEIAQELANQSKEAWEPFARAIQSAMSQTPRT